MKEIVFTRIDDRLIHGQVMTAWLQLSKASEVVISDDKTAKDSFMTMIMKGSMPAKIGLKVLSTDEAANYLKSEGNNGKVFLLVKTPMELEKLSDKGVEIPSVCVGGMGAKAGREVLYRNISASKEERQTLKVLTQKGMDVFIQVLSEDTPMKVEDVLK
ncbi:PTS system mannose/fructose/N-acetylgalactosamine-transporter subunit IIB [Candidatus Enterococcus ferrettii]|uniref:PTS system, mannose-specific IIB component n=1 Tax=Candidatus Enterococcus ferrettii TaxID=2815324 RepID=A0ABV0EZ77_9ENTE|nr:PTS sugar transporter subunit IIB [Enterococcus sp. 665A]MBO1340141.1 PTS sugar transporter subunit IIB [Enterococcus sp. 665A]